MYQSDECLITPIPGSDSAVEIPTRIPETEHIGHGFKHEMKAIVKLSLPVAITNTLQFLVLAISIMMTGRLTKVEMDAVALGNSMINAFGIGIGVGMCTACDTLFSQSYGSFNKKRTGMWLQKSLLVINSCVFVVIAVHLNFEPILILVGQVPEVARLTARYMALFSPGLLLQWNYLILARYLQTQNKINIPMVAGLIGNIFNAGSQYFLIYVLGYRYEVSAYCQMATFGLMLITEVVYILVSKIYVDTWDGPKREAMAGWGEFLFLALAGIGHVSLESICWEIGTFVSGFLGTTQLAVQSILFQAETILFMTAFGISIAVNIRVGQSLGGNYPFKAKRALVAGWTIAACCGVAFGILCLTCRDYIPMIYTHHRDVIEATAQIFPLMGLFILLDSVHIVSAGALRGCGRQKVGALLIFLGFYLLGEPIGIYLGVGTQLGVLGLWIGVLIGLCFTMACETTVLLRQDWTEQARKARHRVQITVTSATSSSSGSDERTSLLQTRRNHKRQLTATEPHGCSIDLTSLRTDDVIPDERFVRLAIKRSLIYLLSFLILVGGILIHIFLPEEAYWPNISNSTLSNETVEITTVYPTELSTL